MNIDKCLDKNWVSVSDSMPPCHTPLLVKLVCGSITGGWMDFSIEPNGAQSMYDMSGIEFDSKVTHWISLKK